MSHVQFCLNSFGQTLLICLTRPGCWSSQMLSRDPFYDILKMINFSCSQMSIFTKMPIYCEISIPVFSKQKCSRGLLKGLEFQFPSLVNKFAWILITSSEQDTLSLSLSLSLSRLSHTRTVPLALSHTFAVMVMRLSIKHSPVKIQRKMQMIL